MVSTTLTRPLIICATQRVLVIATTTQRTKWHTFQVPPTRREMQCGIAIPDPPVLMTDPNRPQLAEACTQALGATDPAIRSPSQRAGRRPRRIEAAARPTRCSHRGRIDPLCEPGWSDAQRPLKGSTRRLR